MNSMIKKIIPFLNENIPEEISFKAISKMHPKMGSFLRAGIQKGLPLYGGIQFLRDHFLSSDAEIDQRLRPDERAAKAQKQRYESSKKTLGALGAIGSAAISPAVTGAIGSLFDESKEMPNPQEQQQKNITPILEDLHNSALGQYIRKSMSEGVNPEEMMATIIRKAPDKIREIEEVSNMPFEDVIDRYLSSYLNKNREIRESSQTPQQDSDLLAKFHGLMKRVMEARQSRLQ